MTEATQGTHHGDPANGRLVGTPAGMETARKLFAHAKKAEDTRNYDYAIELYVQGLSHWPDAIDEGLRKLRVVATARKMVGGKSSGFLVRRKFPTNGKDPGVNLNNGLRLFGFDPAELASIEQILDLAVKAKCDRVGQWICPILTEALSRSKKLSSSHYQSICDRMLEMGRMAREFGNHDGAMEIFRATVAAATIWRRHHPDSSEGHRAESAASGELTIVKGKFDTADKFTDSLQDADKQRDIQDSEKTVTSVDRNQLMIDAAMRDWEQNRSITNKLLKVVELMTRTGEDAREKEAIKLLEEEFSSTENYIFRARADDLRVRRMRRERTAVERELSKRPDDEELRERLAAYDRKLFEVEIRVYRDRLKHYPTDLKLKFELAVRLFRMGEYDEAIPLLQQARADGRVRTHSRLYLGRCFFQKHFYDQAVDVLRQAAEEAPSRTEPVFLDITYWLARGLESSNAADEAKKAYGEIIQVDYNFRDARQRLERLVESD
ncbi:MAG TPA: tetratricopeptide repeat protein [Phycisphaerae bacterium]|nr:tetratricopeptide repeat protein [Phycisphaerae bacterium]HRW51517.1 tetratricopeptide repeat protein [Phycisphaerae bacterium]